MTLKGIPRPNTGNRNIGPKNFGNTSILDKNGCHRHNDCFTCPLPECKFEYAHEIKALKRLAKANA